MINRDSPILGLQHGDSPWALNTVVNREGDLNGTGNEPGFALEFTQNKTVIGVITTPLSYVIFSGTGEDSEIGVYDINGYVKKLADPGLNFGQSSPIEGTYYFNNKGELIVAWWDGLLETANVPRILNLDCLPFEVDGNKALINAEDIKLLQLFPDLGVTEFNLIRLNNSGGSLKTAAYFFAAAYEFKDGTISPYLGVSLPVMVNKSTSVLSTSYNGEDTNVDTTKSIQLEYQNVPTYVDTIRIAVIQKNNGVYTVKVISGIPVTEQVVEFLYTGKEGITSSLSEVLIPTTAICRVWAGTQVEGKLHFGNVELAPTPKIQAYVNNLTVKWIYDEDLIELAEKPNSNKEAHYIFNRRQFKSNEVMALYLVGTLHNGQKVGYHIPGRDFVVKDIPDYDGNTFVNVAENALISSVIAQHPTSETMLQGLAINASARIHEIINTAETNGILGYWENQNEIYPDTDCFLVLDGNNNEVGDLRGRKVRHHKLPSSSQLRNWYGQWAQGPEAGINDAGITFMTLELGAFTSNSFAFDVVDDFDYSEFGEFDAGDPKNRKFDIVKKGKIRIKVEMDFTGVGSGKFAVRHLLNNGITREHYVRDYNGSGNDDSFIDYITLEVEPGQSIELQFSSNTSTPGIAGTNLITFQDWSFVRANVASHALGFKIEDIDIPEQMRAQFSYFELAYAERTDINTTVRASAFGNIGSQFFGTSLDMFTFRSETDFDFVDVQIGYRMENGVFNSVTEESRRAIRKANDSQYLPAFATVGAVNNSSREERLYTSFSPSLSSLLPGGETQEFYMYYVDLKLYKQSVYNRFDSQKLILTGKVILPDALESGFIYGGDTYMGIGGFFKIDRTKYIGDSATQYWQVPYPDVDDYQYHVEANIYPTESTVHSGFRTSKREAQFVPQDASMAAMELSVETEGDAYRALFLQNNNTWLYNIDYHSLANFVPILVFVCKDGCNDSDISKLPYRIYASQVQNKETGEFNWRTFPANSYFDLVKNKGEIWALKGVDRSLMINTLYSFFVAAPRDKLATNDLEVYLSDGNIFSQQPTEILTTDNGYAGCQSKWTCILTKAGYFFIDLDQGKVFIYTGKLEEISANKNRQYFRRALKDTYPTGIDNPFGESGLSAVWDEPLDRIIFSKIIRGDGVINGTKSITMSWDIGSQRWISFHSYKASYMAHNRFKGIVIDNGTLGLTGAIYSTHASNYCRYFGATNSPWYVDIALVYDQSNKQWKDVGFVLQSRTSNGAVQYRECCSHIAFYNDQQGSGLVALAGFTKLGFSSVNVRNVLNEWKFNELQDMVGNNTLPIIDSIGNFVGSNIQANKVWHKRGRYLGKVLVVRIYHDNVNQRKISLQAVNGTFLPAVR
jgi:hypothetical protein